MGDFHFGKVIGELKLLGFRVIVDLTILQETWTATLVELGPRFTTINIRGQIMPPVDAASGNIKLPDDQGTYLSFKVLDSKGNPVSLDESLAQVSSSDVNIAVASLATALDGHPEITPASPAIKVVPTGKTGTVQINASIPLSGSGQLTASATIDVVPGGPATLEMVPTGITFPAS